MSELNTAFEVWSTLKDDLKNPGEAAVDVINCLIDNLGYSSEQIKDSDFISDPDIKSALVDFDVLHPDEEEDEEYWKEDNEDY